MGTEHTPGALLGYRRQLPVRPGAEDRDRSAPIADEGGFTRVELEHRRLDRFGARREEMRNVFDKTGDWGQLLAAFAQRAESSEG
jgi:hypothetical protein